MIEDKPSMAVDIDNDVVIVNVMKHVTKYDVNFETRQFLIKDFPNMNSPA